MNYISQLTEVSRRFYTDRRVKPTHISLYHAIFQMANAARFPAELHLSRAELMKLSKIKSTVTYYKCLKQLTAWKYISYQASSSPMESSLINVIEFKETKKKKKLPNQNLIHKESKNDSLSEEHNQKMIHKESKNDSLSGEHNQKMIHKRLKNDTQHNQNLIFKESKNDSVVIPYINIYKHYTNNINYRESKAHFFLILKNFFQEEKKPGAENLFTAERLSAEAEKFINYYEAQKWQVNKKPMEDWRPYARNWLIRAAEFENKAKAKPKLQKPVELIHNLSRKKDYSVPL